MRALKMLLSVCLLLMAGCSVETKEDTVIKNENGINTVKFDNKEMDWFRFGNEDGPKVVILPGISLKSVMGSKDAVIAAYSLLAEDYDVYLFDEIRVLPEGYTIADMADDALRAIGAIGLDDVNIMGVSHGGMAAQLMAIKDPETVHSLMLCSTSSRIEDRTALQTWKKLAEERDLPALMASFGEYVYTPSFFEQYRDLILASGEGATEQDYQNFLISVEGTMDFDCYEQLKDIHCPCLVIGASEDRILGVQASYDLAERLHCDCFIYEGYGHGVYDEVPDYLTHIKAFLDGVNE
ncbi:MAG: alpha/beta hydrolase [Erysipelotrichaceae bacterium]|nr:alpha/beta hydrolase [Erysipelotrichaceae bacterium]